MKKLPLLLALAALAALAALYLRSTETRLALDPPVKAIGAETPVGVRVENPHGIRRLTIAVEQNGNRHTALEQTNPATRFRWGGSEPARRVVAVLGSKRIPELRDGKAKLIVEAVSNDLAAKTATLATEVEVVTRPPALAVDTDQHYINQGGSELVTFSVAGYWTEAGVRAGKYTFRSFPLPGKPDNAPERFSLFAFPWDLPADTVPVVYARNPGGNEVAARFWHKVFPKPFRSRELQLDDAFLQKVANELDPGGQGDLLARFLRINGAMRRHNNQTLADLRRQTEPRVLWSGPFLQLGNSQVESQFADQRTYVYQGKRVDRQTHLGFDLAVTQNVPVPAANSGKIVYAAPLGIYGNCVVVDHGYGLQSIYGHLSAIAVKAGDAVQKGQVLGKSGATGLAGGDHLHFSMQVDGVQVSPVEWWDAHWIEDRILSKLPVEKAAAEPAGKQ